MKQRSCVVALATLLLACSGSSAPPKAAPAALPSAPPATAGTAARAGPTALPTSGASCAHAELPLVFPAANRRDTYFTIHRIAEAHELSQGDGIRVGIMDHSFAVQAHPELYADSVDFAGEAAIGALDEESHGYWMALTLREIAPKAEIVALNTASMDEAAKVDAMVRAIDWAIANKVRVLTYSSRSFSDELRPRLDRAVDRAIEAGIVTTFVHYPHARNLLPTWLGGRSGDDQREPDVNVLHYDYKVLFPKAYREYRATGKATGWGNFQPFLSISSTSPVTAGVVALMLRENPSLSPDACKRLLMSTARAREFQGQQASRAIDARAAVEAARASKKRNR